MAEPDHEIEQKLADISGDCEALSIDEATKKSVLKPPVEMLYKTHSNILKIYSRLFSDFAYFRILHFKLCLLRNY